MTNREKFSTEISSFTDNELATFMYAYKIATNDDILDKKDLTIADYKKWLSKEAELSASNYIYTGSADDNNRKNRR